MCERKCPIIFKDLTVNVRCVKFETEKFSDDDGVGVDFSDQRFEI